MSETNSSDSDGFEIHPICFMFHVPGRNLTQTSPLLEDKVRHVEELSGRAPPAGANMTESIRNIKVVIEETRNLVNRVFFLKMLLNGLFQKNATVKLYTNNGVVENLS